MATRFLRDLAICLTLYAWVFWRVPEHVARPLRFDLTLLAKGYLIITVYGLALCRNCTWKTIWLAVRTFVYYFFHWKEGQTSE